jgi:iron complex outermembrane recepter protein
MQLVSARAVLLGSVAAVAVIASPVSAQENPASGEELAVDQQTLTQAAEASDQDIIVTARRRTELLLDVPIAVTAYSGEQLARQGALDITDVGDTTPNVTFEVSRGTNTTLTAFIRGVGQQDPVAGYEQGVGLYLDDVYLNRPQASVLDIYEVERIEVLRGPQGTLYGRNTIGGAIKYVTRRIADEPRLSARANIGTDRRADLILTASTPVGEAMKIGGSVARLTHGGFGKNLTTGADNYNRDIWATRATIELQPSPTIWVRLSGDHSWDNSNPRGGHRLIPGMASGAPVLSNVFDTRGGLDDPQQRVRSGGVALRGEAELNDWLQFRTITAYRRDRTATPIDFDALPAVDLDVPAIYKNSQFSQELQFLIDRGPLAGIVGAYYLDANAYNVFDVRLYTAAPALLPGLTASTEGDVDTRTWAIFGDFTYDFTPQWSVSLGGRYTSDRRSARVLRQNRILGGHPELGGAQGFGTGTVIATTSNFEGQRKDTAFTPRASVSFKPDRDHNLYLSYSRGFKGGGFDPRGQSSQAPSQSPQDVYDFMAFDPETVDSYELGWKASLFANRLQIATALFHADYKDVQVPGSAGCVVGGVQTFCGITTNAGKARFRGVEFEGNLRVAEDMAAPGDRLNLAGSLGYLDAQYREFITNIPGQGPVDVADFRSIQNTPKWTASGSLDYSTLAWGGRLFANTTVSYRSASQQFELPSPGLDQEGFALWDANLVWRSPGNRFELGIHGKNLTDKEYVVAGYNFLAQNPFTGEFILSGSGNPIPTLGTEGVLTAYYGNPRQVFVSLGVNF